MFYKGPRPIKYDGNILMAINGLYNGKYYVRSKPGTATIGGVYYNNGDPANGVYNNVYYSNGTPGTGSFGGLYYVNGSKFTGYANNNYYNGGTTITSNGSRTWNLSSDLSFVSNAASILLDTGHILFAGGTYVGSPTDQWELIDPAQNFNPIDFGMTGSTNGYTTPMPGVVFGNTLIKLTNGKVVSIGGKITTSNDSRRQETYIFDPSKIKTYQSRWSTSLSLPSTEIGVHSDIILVPGTNKVIITGGKYYTASNTLTASNKAYLLDYDNETVTQLQNMPVPKARHSSVFIPDGRLLVWGGYGGATGSAEEGGASKLYSYNINTDQWTFVKQSGYFEGKAFAKAHYVGNDTVYFISIPNGSGVGQTLASYNIALNTFTMLTPLGINNGPVGQDTWPDQGGRIATHQLPDNRVLIYGMNNSITSPDPGVCGIYDISTNTCEVFDNTGLSNTTDGLFGGFTPANLASPNLILLSNNKLFAYSGKQRFSVLDF